MNSEHLSDFLLEVARTAPMKFNDRREEKEVRKKFLNKTATNTLVAVSYISTNYTDVDLIQSIIGQILALYYKGGTLRLYSLQFLPGFIAIYLLALSKKQQKSASLFETFLIAIYNEEIVEAPTSDVKKVEEVRIPSIRHHSIYHDPAKIQVSSEGSVLRSSVITPVQSTVRIGPYPAFPKFSAENKFTIINKLCKSVNESLFDVSSEVAVRYICLSSLSICLSGFSFPETGFRNKVLESESQEVLEDFSRKPRQQVTGGLLNELLRGCYLSLFNGAPDLALRAIDAIHLRAQYEMLPDVLLVVNSLRNSLLDNMWTKEKRGELMWTKPHYKEQMKRKDMVTNASLRMKRMPEDIPVQEQAKEKEHSRLGELVEEGIDHLHDLKKKMVGKVVHHKNHRRKKSVDVHEELQPINEEKSSVVDSVEEKKVVLNSEDIEKRLNEVELDIQDEVEEKKTEKGTFTFVGLRHMDSGGSTYRSIDS